jgi:hypoxanthine phosphoribosyltransferase
LKIVLRELLAPGYCDSGVPNDKEPHMRILLTEEQLQEGIRRLAGEIQKHYGERPLTMVGVLIGSVVLLADLVRLLNMPLRLELVQARCDREKGVCLGPLAIDADLLSFGVQGRHVLLVDDIFDTGRTLWDLIPQIDELGPASIRSAVLLQKEGKCQVAIKPDFVGFTIPNEFVVGYGLDHRDMYRNLPHLAALEPHEIQEESSR